VLGLLPAQVLEQCENVAVRIQVSGGESGSVLGVAAVSYEELQVGLRQKGEVVILHQARGADRVLADGGGRGNVVVVVGAPAEVVTIAPVLLDPQACGLVGIVSEALGVEQDLVKQAPAAFSVMDAQ